MCGICGIALREGRVEESRLRAMNETLRHRGPDDDGLYLAGNIGLAHRRLSIVDLAGGHQPLANEDGTVRVVYNGEVYNHAAIRAGLVEEGHQYSTRSDTETLVHLYESRGVEGVHELRGMFAYALWDAREKQLLLVRDRLGVKPLYYAFEDGRLVWASEIKAILRSGYVRPRLRVASLPEYLVNRYTSGENTLFEGVKRLLPGHYLLWKNGRLSVRQYWDLDFGKPAAAVREEDAVRAFKELFVESVRLRLMSDVPLGMFLSGGIDSSAIAAVMSTLVQQPIKTFSVAFSEREANELAWARLVAARYGTDHHEIILSPRDFFSALPKLIWHEDEPIAFPSSVPLYFVSRLAADHVKVVLTGEGSDELLAGYGKYRKTLLNLRAGRFYGRLPVQIRESIRRLLSAVAASSRTGRRLERTFLYLDPGIETIYFDNFAAFPSSTLAGLLTSETADETGGASPHANNLSAFERHGEAGVLDRILYADIKTYLAELLMKQDQMSMAASIESRVPFLDHKLVEFVAGLPEKLKLRGWTTKFILRRAMADLLPREVLTRRKMGFPVPVGAWFRSNRFLDLEDILLGPRAMERGYFRREYVAGLLQAHRAGKGDHAERLWSLVNFELWNRIFIDGETN